ncbi:MAG: HAMP domain-containing histidine kinase [Clostridia bacterium]|nr:HAMP domain-containing histidine kinase [Clostridia bacterium]
MNTDFNTKPYEELNERENLQELFDTSFIKNDLKSLRTHYKTLRKLELSTPLDFNLENVDVSSLAENLALACDIICAENGASFIYCGDSTSIARANQRLFTKAILNLLSNAFLYGRGNLITVKTIEKTDFISIEIQNAGWLNNDFKFGNGLEYVNHICQKLNGHFFIATELLSVKAIMLIPKSQNIKEIVTTPDFCEFLGNRLSPVYIEFFGI